MAALKKFGEAKKQFAGEVDFIIVYISEAHPTDEWSFDFKGQPQVAQPVSLDERLDCAKIMLDSINFEVDVYVDNIDNRANLTFGAIPERLIVIRDDIVDFIGGIGPFNYSIPDLISHLEKY